MTATATATATTNVLSLTARLTERRRDAINAEHLAQLFAIPTGPVVVRAVPQDAPGRWAVTLSLAEDMPRAAADNHARRWAEALHDAGLNVQAEALEDRPRVNLGADALKVTRVLLDRFPADRVVNPSTVAMWARMDKTRAALALGELRAAGWLERLTGARPELVVDLTSTTTDPLP